MANITLADYNSATKPVKQAQFGNMRALVAKGLADGDVLYTPFTKIHAALITDNAAETACDAIIDTDALTVTVNGDNSASFSVLVLGW